MNYCLIPCKSNSKRLPGKNFKEFFGTPIWIRVLKTAIESQIFDEINTMSDDGSRLARDAYNISIPPNFKNIHEPSKITDSRTLSDVLDDYLDVKGITSGSLGILLPTSVFITSEEIKWIAGCEMTKNLFVGKRIDKKAVHCYINGKRLSNEYKNKVSQETPQPMIDTGQFYWLDIDRYLKERVILSEECNVYELPRPSIDIDTQEDWDAAEKLYMQAAIDHAVSMGDWDAAEKLYKRLFQ